MPEGTFIPISTTFQSIMAASETSSEAQKNLQSTFDKHIPKEKMLPQKSPITISPIRLSDVEEDVPGKVNEEMQMDPVPFGQSEVQTEVRTCQTEWEQEGKSCQMEWEQEGKSCQIEWQQKGKSCQTEWEQEGVACQMECDQKGVEC